MNEDADRMRRYMESWREMIDAALARQVRPPGGQHTGSTEVDVWARAPRHMLVTLKREIGFALGEGK